MKLTPLAHENRFLTIVQILRIAEELCDYRAFALDCDSSTAEAYIIASCRIATLITRIDEAL